MLQKEGIEKVYPYFGKSSTEKRLPYDEKGTFPTSRGKLCEFTMNNKKMAISVCATSMFSLTSVIII